MNAVQVIVQICSCYIDNKIANGAQKIALIYIPNCVSATLEMIC